MKKTEGMEENVNIEVMKEETNEPTIHIIVELKQWDKELATYVSTYISEKQTTKVWKRTLTPILNDFSRSIQQIAGSSINNALRIRSRELSNAIMRFNALPWYKKLFYRFKVLY